MKVEFFVEGEEDALGGGRRWCNIPNVGEIITLNGVTYVVKSRDWGTYVQGDGESLWDEPYVAIWLATEAEKDIEALLDFVRDILPGEWRCKRCKQKVDMARKRCGCAVSPSPWYLVDPPEDWSKL